MAFIPLIGAAVAGAVGSASSVIGIGATLLGAAGSAVSGIAASNAANYNAEVQQQQAHTALEQGAIQAGNAAETSKQRVAAASAGMLENGTELTGSNSSLLDEMTAQGKLDEMTAVYSGQVKATGYQNQAKLYQSQAGSDLLGGFMGAGSKLMTGAADFYKNRSTSISV